MNKPQARINNLQGIRLYAAIPVILYHTGFRLPGIRPVGVFGVHLFFLLSGYIMASIIDHDTTAFLRRRLIRILPLYWTLTLLLYAVAWKFPHLMSATRAVPSELLKSIFFVPFAKSNGQYKPILFVGWTINYEMFFYMMLSAAVLINRKRAALLGAAMVLTVMGVSSLFVEHSAIARFYSDPVLFECLLGLAAYYVVRFASPRLSPAMKPLLVVFSVAAMLLLPSIEECQLMSNLPMVLRFGPLSFLLICSVCLLAFHGTDLRVTTLVLLGDASYVMYLVHPYIEEFLDRVIGRFIPMFHITTPLGCLIAMAFVLPISVFLFLKVDKPIVRYLNRTLCGGRRIDQAPLPSATVQGTEASSVAVLHQAPAMTQATFVWALASDSETNRVS